MIFLIKIVIIFSIIRLGLADVSLLHSVKSQSFHPNKNGEVEIDISWIDDGFLPHVSKITHFTISLFGGSNNDMRNIKTLAPNITLSSIEKNGSAAKPNWNYHVKFDQNTTGNGWYFFQVVSTIGDFETYTIHYSQRFQLLNMAKNTTNTHWQNLPPPAADTTTSRATSKDNRMSEYFTVPYAGQTGSIRYAPMMPTVDTTTTNKRWQSPLSKTSLTTFTKVGQTAPTVAYTITQPQTQVFVTSPNTAKPTKNPSSWYPASKLIKLTPSIK